MAKKKTPSKKSVNEIIQNIKEVFDSLDLYSNTPGYQQALRLWDLLCGLRGPDEIDMPDDERLKLKLATTAVLRHALSPKIMELSADAFPDNPSKKELRKTLNPHSHFVFHVQKAFQALGLEW